MKINPLDERVTMDHVARLSGYSKATVSRVINREHSVKPSTVAKVEEVIRTLGYTPNSAASALSGGKSRTVAMLLPDVLTEYYASLLTGAEGVAEEKNYNLLLKTRSNKRGLDALVHGRKVDAFIIRSNGLDAVAHDFLISLRRREIPFLFIGRPPAGIDSPAVLIDNVGGSRQMAHHYAGHHFKSILFLAGLESNFDSNDRLYGFKMGLSEAGYHPDAFEVRFGAFTRELGYANAKTALAERHYDAIFAANDQIALGALQYCREAGIRVPQDLAITGFDDSYFSEFLSPSLTTVRQPMHDIGVVAMETIVKIIELGDARDHQVILPTRLMVRQSCGCPIGD
ncbi:MAG: LacI family transcriptional regulator [Spirochaetes bacterium]|nr:MAG: LacI family transcriptional regulator [Spirochaetota bacterium]